MPLYKAWPKPPLPNRQEGERPPQMDSTKPASMRATTWADRARDFFSQFEGDPAGDAMGLAGPMEVPGMLGIGIVKTLGRNAPVTKLGKWGRGPAQEALEYLTSKFPRLSQQVQFLMDDTLGPATSARWSPDNYLPYNAQRIAEGGERFGGKAGSIKLNPMIHAQGQGADTSVNSIAHEMQHAADNLRRPSVHDPAYHAINVEPFGYTKNPYENLANITGAMEQGGFLQQAGRAGEADTLMHDWGLQMSGRFPESMKDVIAPFLLKSSEAPAAFLKSMRLPNRAIIDMAEETAGKAAADARAWDKFNKALKSPDALRKAILARKGR